MEWMMNESSSHVNNPMRYYLHNEYVYCIYTHTKILE
jgi:hypothetical protein